MASKKKADLKHQQECVFCEIVSKETPSNKIYEDEDYYAFLDISRFTQGHTLVIPKVHIEFVWDSDDIGNYFSVVQKIADHYRSLGYEYVDSFILGRKVSHAHIHLPPHNDGSSDYKEALEKIGKMQGDPKRRLNIQEGKRIARKLKMPSRY